MRGRAARPKGTGLLVNRRRGRIPRVVMKPKPEAFPTARMDSRQRGLALMKPTFGRRLGIG